MIAGRRNEQRRARRRPKRTAAWIELASGGTHIPCMLWDISDGGARIAAPRAKVLPMAFNLLMSKDGRSQRVCRVAWRSEGQLGVQFVENMSLDDVLVAGALRQLPKVTEVGASQTVSAEAMALLLPGYGAGLLGRIEKQGRPLSSIAGMMMFMLLAATAVLILAAMQQEAAPWAMQVCTSAANFCEHPEWTGIAGGLMALVFLSARGMEL